MAGQDKGPLTGTIHYDAGTGEWWIDDPMRAGGRRAINNGQAQRYLSEGWALDAPGTNNTNPNPPRPQVPVGQGGGPQGPAPPDTPPPASPPPTSYDPPGGGPNFTPGISFGKGVIPGQGDTYQRQWFDVGSQEGTGQLYYQQPENWNYAWDKVLNQFGGQVGGDFYKFLQGFSNTAKGDYSSASSYDPNLYVANFLDQYAPQIRGVYGLLPSTQTHGGTGPLAGRSTY